MGAEEVGDKEARWGMVQVRYTLFSETFYQGRLAVRISLGQQPTNMNLEGFHALLSRFLRQKSRLHLKFTKSSSAIAWPQK